VTTLHFLIFKSSFTISSKEDLQCGTGGAETNYGKEGIIPHIPPQILPPLSVREVIEYVETEAAFQGYNHCT
jgi:hypothetical protein